MEGSRKECKKNKTKAERIIKSAKRRFADMHSNDKKRYHDTLTFIWPDGSLSFLFTDDYMDIIPIGEKAHKIAINGMGAANADNVYFYKGKNSWTEMENKS